MGDKHRSETQKPVKNTLLSGASHGFPFESFQGSSMLIPVSQDSPSVLNDSVGDVNQTDPRNASNSENVTQLIQGVRSSTLEDKSSKDESKSSSQAASQGGYTGIFNTLFGGGGSSNDKRDLDLGSSQPEKLNQSSHSTVSPFPSSPTVVSNVQTFSPPLQVPSNVNEPIPSEPSPPPIGFVHSSASPFQQTHAQPWSSLNAPGSNSNTSDASLFQKVEFSQGVPLTAAQVPPYQDQPGTWQNLMNKGELKGTNYIPQQFPIGFKPYSDLKSKPPLGTVPKAQSSFDLPVEGTLNQSSAHSFFNTSQSQSTTNPNFYQMRAGSVDSFKPIQPPSAGAPPPINSGPSLSSAPPISTSSLKNYRRDHHKRPSYAPVPGLTSSTVVSTAYLTSSENFPNYSSQSYSSLPTTTPKHQLSTSLSQPSMDMSVGSADLNTSTSSSSTSASSLNNFFVLNYTSSNSSNSQNYNNQAYVSTPSTESTDFNRQNVEGSVYPPPPTNSAINQTSNFSLSSSESGQTVSSVTVRPPIMSVKEQTSVNSNYTPTRVPSPSVIPPSLNNLANLGHSGIIYRPAYHHWFLRIETKDKKEIWQPFSMTDSLALEQALNSDTLTPETVVPTDGGRYDVNVSMRTQTAVYWEEKPKKVMRCSWFYKSTTESRLHPYDENTAFILEEEYKKSVMANSWNRKVDLPGGDYIIMYGPSSMALFQCTPQMPEGWEAETDFAENTSHRPKIVKRGVLDDFEIEDGEPQKIDHLIFVVHGIGSVCDLKFRTIEEAVDGFRNKSIQLIKSHFRTSSEQGQVNRVEILPVSWHGHLHGETTGVDKKLQTITLKSIPRLRHFTNDTLLDILFYTSPMYCQNIMQQVGREINTLYTKFKARNPGFEGGVSLVGHSLGSLILFDMLCHQKPVSPRMENITEVSSQDIINQDIQTNVLSGKKKPSLSRKVSYVIGTAGTGQPYIEYPQLGFQPVAFFAMGSPIGMFVTVRGIDSLGLDFSLPTCSKFFNIFHPFDPVAYRIEALINPELSEKRPVLIPHHKGRKRMHLELKETMARVGADLKQRLIDSVRSTWNTVYQLTMFGRADDGLEQEVDKVIEKQLERQQTETAAQCLSDCYDTEFNAGKLNQGRRIDYVLQEAPLESFNEYVSALISHVIYWDSEDTMLLILKEVYSSMGISPDNQSATVPVQEDLGSPSVSPYNSDANSPMSSSTQYGFK